MKRFFKVIFCLIVIAALVGRIMPTASLVLHVEAGNNNNNHNDDHHDNNHDDHHDNDSQHDNDHDNHNDNDHDHNHDGHQDHDDEDCPEEEVTPTPSQTPVDVDCPQGQVYSTGLHICISCPGGGDCEVVIGNTPTPTPTETPAQNPQQGGGPGDGRSDGASTSPSVEQKQGEVLGASTLPATGSFDSILATIGQGGGLLLAGLGITLNGKKKKSKKNSK